MTMKIMYAVHLTPKIEFGWKVEEGGQPHRPRSAAADRGQHEDDPLPRRTRTPTDRAASSSSRIACSDAPRRLRSSTKTAPRARP